MPPLAATATACVSRSGRLHAAVETRSLRPDSRGLATRTAAWTGVAALFAALVFCGCKPGAPAAPRPGASRAQTLVASIRAEPRSFNRYVARDLSTEVVTLLMHASLVRIDRITQQLEPRLAERWELLSDQVTYEVHLRRGLRFSDGQPFSSADVVFSFRAVYDPRVGSLLAETLEVGGKPLVVTAVDADTVRIRFPAPFGPGLRMLDGVPILPRHRLEPALDAGTFATAWSVAADPSTLAGLGPFVLGRYQPGERMVFDRNPHYWERDGTQQLPGVDRLVLEIVSDQAAEGLQLEAGAIDATQGEMRPADYRAFKGAVSEGRLALHDLGVGPDGDWLWFNLAPSASPDHRRRWLQHAEFRRAVSQAVDRDAFVDSVYLGAAVPAHGIVSPGNSEWYVPVATPGFSVVDAQRRLAALGLIDRDKNGIREDADGQPVRFTLLTEGGNTSLERGAAALREALHAIGVEVDVVTLDATAVIDRIMRGDYDAVYFRLLTSDSDPALNLDFWLSGGSAHVWHPNQAAPGLAWEGEIDRLMERVATVTDQSRRRILFGDVQRVLAREEPALCFAFPRVSYAMSTRVTQARPAVSRPPLLWNPAIIRLRKESN
jgi:peptide/nickel transport system substrate-binding protein